MSSVNSEEIPQPPKHRLSPFELRNTDLVSRLLAATPPYLYNMPLVPHSYFFSEMLRSLVQNKVEAAARMAGGVPHRRSRKRTWAQGRPDFHKIDSGKESHDMPPPTWTPPKIAPDRKSLMDRPLELTTKLPANGGSNNNNNNNNNNINNINNNSSSNNNNNVNVSKSPETAPPTSTITCPEKPDVPSGPMVFPPLTNPPENQTSPSTDLILPPPPPIWYPPIYPPPYGIDPLHFFIDLRVSGHIYDRKNQTKEFGLPEGSVPGPVPSSSGTTYGVLGREPRHSSAFAVPNQNQNQNPNPNDPLNLTSTKSERKFDIKSMGFDAENRQSSNYVLKNLTRIYRSIGETRCDADGVDLTKEVKEEDDPREEDGKDCHGKESRCKDLRALIGLELVVDYVNHSVKRSVTSEESSTDVDSRCSSASGPAPASASGPLEIV